MDETGILQLTPLSMAILNNRSNAVELLMNDLKCNVHVQDEYGRTLLHLSCVTGSKELLSKLISLLDPTVKDNTGLTILHTAACFGHIEIIRYLILEKKADIESYEQNNFTPVILAAANGHMDIVKELVDDFKCNSHIKGMKRQTLLHYSCRSGHIELTRQLIKVHQLVPSAVDDDGNTPMHLAAWGGHVEIIKYLHFNHNVHIDTQNNIGQTPLVFAIANGKRETSKILVHELKSDFKIEDTQGYSLIHHACSEGHTELADKLVSEYHLKLTKLAKNGLSPLELAARNGHISLLKFFTQKYKFALTLGLIYQAALSSRTLKSLMTELECNLLAKDFKGRNILHYFALYGGNTTTIDELVSVYQLDPMSTDNDGNTPLHAAALRGQISILKHLIEKYEVEINIRNKQNSTPLCFAATTGKEHVVKLLIEEYQSSPNVRGENGQTLLHYACRSGSNKLVRLLTEEYRLDPMAQDDDRFTPLHVAIQGGDHQNLKYFLEDRNLDISHIYWTLVCSFHLGSSKNATVVQKLLTNSFLKHREKVLPFIKDGTILHCYVCESDNTRIVDLLVSELGIDPRSKDENGNTPLHLAASNGRVELVEHLIIHHGAEIDDSNQSNHTPISLAATNGHIAVVKVLLEKFNCDPHTKGSTLLHYACRSGNINLIEYLTARISNPDLTALDDDGNSPLHVATQYGHIDTFQFLTELFTKEELCSYSVHRNSFGQSLLHMACFSGNMKMVKFLLDVFHLSLLSVDLEGSTPLHIAAKQGNSKCVNMLLSDYNAPIHIKNSDGYSCHMLANRSEYSPHVNVLFKRLVKGKGSQPQQHYEEYLKLSEEHQTDKVVRVFVMGHHGGGKSTLVDTLKRALKINTWFNYASEIEPHTAGIVPNVVDSSQCGRLIIYDFAGDSEYYSSHAAILKNYESQASSSIYVIVLNLKNGIEQIKFRFGYWLTFISTFQQDAYILPIGSHSDQYNEITSAVAKRLLAIDETTNKFALERKDIQVLDSDAIDCRQVKQVGKSVRDIIQQVSTGTPANILTLEAKFLIGLLKKEFSKFPTYNVGEILDYIIHHNIPLPREQSTLYPVLKELYHTGLLLLIEQENVPIADYMIILQLEVITKELHQKLFSKSAKQNISSKIDSIKLTVGLIPEILLPDILPKHITKECLVYLQYCQELQHVEISQDFTITASESVAADHKETDSVLFFPALCEVKRCNSFWIREAKSALGWYAVCEGQFEYFPIRFLHVLTMRIIHKFPVKQHGFKPNSSASDPRQEALKKTHRLNPGCQVWTTGVHWLMENGVEVLVDMVKECDSKRLIVITRASEDCKVECATTLQKIVQVISETKVELCHRLSPSLYLLHPDDLIGNELPSVVSLSCFPLEDVLECWRNKKKYVLSADRERSKQLPLKNIPMTLCIHWNVFFPMDSEMVLSAVEKVDKWNFLGLNLGIMWTEISLIDCEHSADQVDLKKERVIQLWMSKEPTWPSLVDALKEPSINDLKCANEIEKAHREFRSNTSDVPLQRKILDENNDTLHPDQDFLQSFATIIGTRWQCFASPLSLTSDEILSIKRETHGAKPTEQALVMLRKWAASETATYGQLRERLRTLSVFHI